eukprot:975973-Alexandrium_andersonii.AAC.1
MWQRGRRRDHEEALATPVLRVWGLPYGLTGPQLSGVFAGVPHVRRAAVWISRSQSATEGYVGFWPAREADRALLERTYH